ncbi:MAG: chemotaxis protein CheW [Myxococcales bacterium]|nr:chemotaxis protein CheW [Myxococcales bacterium]
MNEEEELLREFLIESYEGLDSIDRDLVAFEADTSPERIQSIFRTMHTIKGTSSFLQLPRIESVAHAAESLLTKLRAGELSVSRELTSTLLDVADTLRRFLRSVEASGKELAEDTSNLVENITRLSKGETRQASKPAAPKSAEVRANVAILNPQPVPNRLGGILVEQGKINAADVAQALTEQVGTGRQFGEVLVDEGKVSPAAVDEALAVQSVRAQAIDSSVRLDVGQLDNLMTLVGELVLARNQILQYLSSSKDSVLLSTAQRLNIITTELQTGVMKTRMQPIASIFSKFPRVVRDLGIQLGKDVQLELVGRETELDRTLIEAIKDPLTHLVRNSVDHGIEMPEVRVAAGKPANGRIELRSYHEGGQVNIEIADDGAGIDVERVRRKAVERGFLTADKAARLSPREVTELIFAPGFSTAEKVTNVSGRGVGMDVVKTNIEKIGGAIDIRSTLGKGTTIQIKIPLTLAIIPALVVTCGGDRYAIPQVNLLELVRLENDPQKSGVETIQGTPVLRLRGNLLPLVRLSDALGVEAKPSDREATFVVVVKADKRQFGLIVDGVNDTEEIVVKPLGRELKTVASFAGATIMGDGRVALILDVFGLARLANIVISGRGGGSLDERQGEARVQTEPLLLFRVSGGGRIAMPLARVARLEEIPVSSVERAGKHRVVQYRGDIMALVDLSNRLQENGARADDRGMLQVVVTSGNGVNFGLVVDEIVDIVDEVLEIKRKSTEPALLGAAVIQGRVTDVLNVDGVLGIAAAGGVRLSLAA